MELFGSASNNNSYDSLLQFAAKIVFFAEVYDRLKCTSDTACSQRFFEFSSMIVTLWGFEVPPNLPV